MGELMFDDSFQLRIHGADSADRDAKLAVIDRSCPGRGLRDVRKFLLGVENDNDVFGWLVAELSGQVTMRFLERCQNLLLQFSGSRVPLIAQREMRALPALRSLFHSLF